MDPPESYAIKENYPSENDRILFCKLASEVPLKQETLVSLINMAKEQWFRPQDMLELLDKVIIYKAFRHVESLYQT